MTINQGIGLVNLGIALAFAALTAAAIHQGRTYWREWPPGFLNAIGVWFLSLALFAGQIAAFRWTDIDGSLGPNGWGTLGLRLLCLGFSLALLRRLVTGRLATDHDRRRVGGDG